MLSDEMKNLTGEILASRLSQEDLRWPFRDDVNGIIFKSRLPQEYMGDHRHLRSFLIRSTTDEVDYYLMCETLFDDSGRIVPRGYPHTIIFDRSSVFAAIGDERIRNKKPALNHEEKQKIFLKLL